MANISAKVRLRPVRFAFLVRPDSGKHILDALRINTCLWGGKYNPIVPVMHRIPSWWDRHGVRFESAQGVVNGYLDFFEPDFLVEAEAGLAQNLGFQQERVLSLSDILMHAGDRNRKGNGLGVFDLYRDLHRHEFQFVRRHEHNIVDVAAERGTFRGLCACLFGAFPDTEGLEYVGKGFADAFSPKQISLNAQSLAQLYRSGFTSALQIGHSKLDVDFHHHHDPALFVFDAKAPRDLVDYWNLRAVRGNVLAVPIQWLQELSDFCKDFIVKNHRPLPGNPHGVMIRATVMFSRSIPTDQIEKVYPQHLQVDAIGANVHQDWYPPFWRPSPGYTVREMRPTLTAAEESFETPFVSEKAEVRFDCLYPDFAEKYGNDNRWANVVSLRDWTYKDQIATAFPSDYRSPTFLRLGVGSEYVLPTTEGLVLFPGFKNSSERWDVPDGASAIASWLKKHQIETAQSDAGRATQQIIQTLGGFHGVASIANSSIIKWLNTISRKPITPSAQHQEFKNRIRDATKGDTWHHRNFETLVERKAVELGLELKCTKCSSWTWYALNNLDHAVSCGLCLRLFPFPDDDPNTNTRSRWAYRLIGPFALPDYARGGYASALAIRFFSHILGRSDRSDVTWSAGQELTLAPTEKIEADFILWYQRKIMFGNDYPTDVMFGEAKSFRGDKVDGKSKRPDAFESKDVERMQKLALRFPGSILVFATMKNGEELTKDEVGRIAKLALWGREFSKDRQQTRAPVIVLTGTELFASFALEHAWKSAGGKRAEIATQGWARPDNLRVLADLTQQVYLSLPSYGSWFEAKWKARVARRNLWAPQAVLPPPAVAPPE